MNQSSKSRSPHSILYFTPSLRPTSTAAAVRASTMIEELVANRYVVRSLSCEGGTGTKTFFALASNKASFPLRLIRELMVGVELFVRVLASKESTVLFSTPPFFTVATGVMAARLRQKHIVLDVRDLYPQVFFDRGLVRPTGIGGRFLTAVTRWMYRQCHQIITVTEGLKTSLRDEDQNPDDKLLLVRNGFDGMLFPHPGRPDSSPIALFHGNLGQYQNIELLIELARRLERSMPEAKIWVAGEGPKSSLLKSATKNLTYLGPISYERIPALISQARVGLSLRDSSEISRTSFPVKVYEYAGAGRPVLVTPKSEAGELVERLGLGSQFENEDIEAIEKNLIERLSEPIDETALVAPSKSLERRAQVQALIRYLDSRSNT